MPELDTEEQLTPGQSNPDDAGQATATVTDDQDPNAQDDSGQADDSGDDDQGGSSDAGEAGASGTEGKKSRGEARHERYIDKLAAEIRQGVEKTPRYTDEIFPSKPYTPIQYKPDEEYDPKQLEDDRSATAQAARAEGIQMGLHQGSSQLEKQMWSDRFDIDQERVTQKWDVLNPDKTETYSPKTEAQLVHRYVAFVGMQRDPNTGAISVERPNVRFKDFVDAEMQNLEEYASARTAASSTNLVKQAANTGVRPNGQARVSKGDHGFDPNDPINSVNRMSSEQYFKLGGKEASDAYLKSRGIG